jgi:hypothetical protein
MTRKSWILVVFVAAILLAACSYEVHEPLEYLSASERHALDSAEHGDATALHALFLRSQTPGMDGEASEFYSAELEEALDRMGPDRFWDALQKESPKVRKSVEWYLDGVLRNNPEYYDLYRKLVPPGERHDASYDAAHPERH